MAQDATIALHHGFKNDPTTKAVAVPIYQTTSYEFDDAAHGAALFNLEVPGNIYTRLMNPTQDVLEQRVAALEGGIAALALASGQAAITYAIQNLAKAGDNIISVPQLYGGTWTLFQHYLPALGIEVRFAPDDKAESLRALADENTKAFYAETIGNPAGNIADVQALADTAHELGVPLIVDNTVGTPILFKPIQWGADIVVHSLTKYIAGHGNSLGGIIVDSGKFPWAKYPEKFPFFSKPEPSYHGVVFNDALGPAAFIGRARTVPLRNTGAAISPFNAFLIIQGLETLVLRIERVTENTLKIAEFLQKHPKVNKVNYAGLPTDPSYSLAQKYTGGKPSGLLTFEVLGGLEAGVKVHDQLQIFKKLVNIGDSKSLVAHPASTTHRQLTPEQQAQAGVSQGLLRLSVGIEAIEDLIADLEQALAVI